MLPLLQGSVFQEREKHILQYSWVKHQRKQKVLLEALASHHAHWALHNRHTAALGKPEGVHAAGVVSSVLCSFSSDLSWIQS